MCGVREKERERESVCVCVCMCVCVCTACVYECAHTIYILTLEKVKVRLARLLHSSISLPDSGIFSYYNTGSERERWGGSR